MTEPRRHHFVPQFYLKGFADSEGRVQVFDLVRGTWRESKCLNEGVIKGLYDLDEPNRAGMEQTLSRIESIGAELIRDVLTRQRLPDSAAAMLDLLAFVAVQSSRSPPRIKGASRFIEDLAKLKTGCRVDSGARRLMRLSQQDAKEFGGYDTEKVTPQDLQVEFDGDNVIVPRAMAVMMAIDGWENIHAHLLRRRWTLGVAQPLAGEFVTSDNPVLVSRLTKKSSFIGNTGFHLPESVVTFPLGRRMLLIGHNDRHDRAEHLPFGPDEIANANALTLAGSDRFIWSRRRRVRHKWRGEVRSDLGGVWLSRPAP